MNLRPKISVKEPAVCRPQKILNILWVIIVSAIFVLANSLADHKILELFPAALADGFYHFGFSQQKHLNMITKQQNLFLFSYNVITTMERRSQQGL